MTTYLTEQEQIQQLKQWVKQYGPPVILGLVLAGLVITGWNYWQQSHLKNLLHASAMYDEMLAFRAQNNEHNMTIEANKLIAHYPKTPYAEMAALMLARSAVEKKQYDEALTQLSWVVKHTSTDSLRAIAQIRMARIFITNQKPDAALDTLKTVTNKSFTGLVQEIRGDAYLAKHDTVAAQKAYQQALLTLPNAEITRPILEMKAANLAVAEHSNF